jgi:hypothetical protein
MGGRRDVGEKPTMWEAWVGKDREVPMEKDVSDEGEGEGEKGMNTWDEILVRIA